MRTELVIALVVVLLTTTSPVGLAHEGGGTLEDPKGDFAKKIFPRPLESQYAGAPCPRTDLLSVAVEPFHGDTSSRFDYDGSLIRMTIADLTYPISDCLFDEGDNPQIVYAFRVHPQNADLLTVFSVFRPDYRDTWDANLTLEFTSITIRDDGDKIVWGCPACFESIDLKDGTLTMSIGTTIAQPPYEDVEVYTHTALCDVAVDTGFCTVARASPERGNHADVVPNFLGEEVDFYTEGSGDALASVS